MSSQDPIVRALMLLEAVASVALSHDPDCQTIQLDESVTRPKESRHIERDTAPA